MEPHRDCTSARWQHDARFRPSVCTPIQQEHGTGVFRCRLFSLPIQQDSGYEVPCLPKMYSLWDASSVHPTIPPLAPRGHSMIPCGVGTLPPIVLSAVQILLVYLQLAYVRSKQWKSSYAAKRPAASPQSAGTATASSDTL